MGRFRSVTVDVDVSLCDFGDDDLIDEIRARGYNVSVSAKKSETLKAAGRRVPNIAVDHSPGLSDELELIADCVRDGRLPDALLILDRLRLPKFRDLEECLAAYAHREKAAA